MPAYWSPYSQRPYVASDLAAVNHREYWFFCSASTEPLYRLSMRTSIGPRSHDSQHISRMGFQRLWFFRMGLPLVFLLIGRDVRDVCSTDKK